MGTTITQSGLDTAITNLRYSNPNLPKTRLIQAIRSFYGDAADPEQVTHINPDDLIKSMWEIEEDPDLLKSKRKNLHSIKMIVNNDLKRLFEEGKNPEGISIGPSNTFVMSEEAKEKLLSSFADSARTQGNMPLEKVADVLEVISDFVSNIKNMDENNPADKVKQILDLIRGMAAKAGIGDAAVSGSDKDEDGMGKGPLDIAALEEIDGEIEENIGIEDDAEIEEVIEDEEIEEIDEDLPEAIDEEELEEVDDEIVEEMDEAIEDTQIDDAEPDSLSDDEVEIIDEEEVEEIEDELIDEVDEEELEEIIDGATEGSGGIDQDTGIGDVEEDLLPDDEVEIVEDEAIEEIEDDFLEEVAEDDLEEFGDDSLDQADKIDIDTEFEDADAVLSADTDIEIVDDEEVEEIEDDLVEEVDDSGLTELDEDSLENADVIGGDTELEDAEMDMLSDDDVEIIDDEEIEEIEDDLLEEVDASELEEIEDDSAEETDEINGDEDPGEAEQDLLPDDEVEIVEDEEIEEVEDDLFDEVDAAELERMEDESVEDADEIVDEDEFEEIAGEDRKLSGEDQFGLPQDNLDQKDFPTDKNLLAEQFDGFLGSMERFYNQYIKIPQGTYRVGSRNEMGTDLPEQEISLPDFYMGKYPVTNALFEVFVERTGYKTTAEKQGYGWVYTGRFRKVTDIRTGVKSSLWRATYSKEKVTNANWYQPAGPGSTLYGKRNHPVVQVSIQDALNFCAWVGKRLPTEFEWEAAARTRTGNRYPWGNEWKEDVCNYEKSAVSDTTPVDQYPEGTNSFGISDTLCNVLEWTSDQTVPSSGKIRDTIFHIAKGGSWISNQTVQLSNRFRFESGYTANILGFRCVAD